MIKQNIIQFAKILCLLVIFDFTYFYFTYDIYALNVAKIQRVALKINIYSAIICYLLIAYCYQYFILQKNATIWDSLFLGLFVYGVYNLTSISLFKKYDKWIVIMDTIWGMILFATVYKIMK